MTEPGWRETKVACCLMVQSNAAANDPQSEPPAKFLEPKTTARLVAEIKRRRSAVGDKADKNSKRSWGKQKTKNKKQARKRSRTGKKKRTREWTVIATMENSEAFGWQVAAKVHRRGLDHLKRKACVCDGQASNWSEFEMHLRPLNFLLILDFVHLLAYLYDSAHAAVGGDAARGWKKYEQWLRWAWSGPR